MTGEFDLIRRLFLPLVTDPGALALSDDAALLSPDAGYDLVITTDTIVETVHYLPEDPPDSVAVKLLGVNLSDLAAMGAEPLAYLLSVALPRAWSSDDRDMWLATFARGVDAMRPMFRLGLLGGDTVSTPSRVCLTATAIGQVPAGSALRRSGAVVDDLIFVSGSIGDAALGLRSLTGTLPASGRLDTAELIDRYRRPRPRLELGQRLRRLANSAADVSDGLVADLGHICRASEVEAVIDARTIPLSSAVRRAIETDQSLLRLVLSGGDDYELVFTAPEARQSLIGQAGEESGVAVTCIGRITGPGASDAVAPVRVVGDEGSLTVGPGGYEHFSHEPRN